MVLLMLCLRDPSIIPMIVDIFPSISIPTEKYQKQTGEVLPRDFVCELENLGVVAAGTHRVLVRTLDSGRKIADHMVHVAWVSSAPIIKDSTFSRSGRKPIFRIGSSGRRPSAVADSGPPPRDRSD